MSDPLELLPLEILYYIVERYLDARSLTQLGRTNRTLHAVALEVARSQATRLQLQRFLVPALRYFSAWITLDLSQIGRVQGLDGRGITWFNLSHRSQAVVDLMRASALSETESDSLAFQAVCMELKGELRQSLICSRRALELDPNHGRACFELAYILQEQPFEPDLKGAEEAYSRALECGYERRYVTFFNRGWAREAAGNLELAAEDYVVTIELNPFFSQAVRSLGRVWVTLGRLDSLENLLGRLKKQSRDEGEEGGHRAVQQCHLLHAAGRLEEAEAAGRVALKEPGLGRPAEAAQWLGWVLRDAGRNDEALAMWKTAVEIEPALTPVREALVKEYWRRGQIENLEIHLQLMAVNGGHARAALLRAELSLADRNPEIAVEAITELIGVHPADFAMERVRLAAALATLDRPREALRHLAVVLEWYPRGSMLLRMQATLLLRINCWPEAEICLRKALEVDSTDMIALTNLAGVLLICHRFDESLELWERTMPRMNGVFLAHWNRAHCLLKLGLAEKALADYETLHEMHPDRCPASLVDYMRNDSEAFRRDLCNYNVFFIREEHEAWMTGRNLARRLTEAQCEPDCRICQPNE